VNDQHITAVATIVQDFLLLGSAGLVGWYLCETRKMRKAAEAQVEAAFRPAVIVWHRGSLEKSPTLENIGNGPAMEVSWTLSDSDLSGNIEFIQPDHREELGMPGMRPVYEAGARAESSGRSSAVCIRCSYRSVSGKHYFSTSTFSLNSARFVPSEMTESSRDFLREQTMTDLNDVDLENDKNDEIVSAP
jgi:hypothetical protein